MRSKTMRLLARIARTAARAVKMVGHVVHSDPPHPTRRRSELADDIIDMMDAMTADNSAGSVTSTQLPAAVHDGGHMFPYVDVGRVPSPPTSDHETVTRHPWSVSLPTMGNQHTTLAQQQQRTRRSSQSAPAMVLGGPDTLPGMVPQRAETVTSTCRECRSGDPPRHSPRPSPPPATPRSMEADDVFPCSQAPPAPTARDGRTRQRLR